jgi:serine/threonine protein kinase
MVPGTNGEHRFVFPVLCDEEMTKKFGSLPPLENESHLAPPLGTLGEIISSSLPEFRSLQIHTIIAEKLSEMHRSGEFHGRLNPCNLLLDNGTLHVITGPQLPDVEMRYTAPEVDDMSAVGWGSDIFTLGTIIYEIQTRERLFNAKTLKGLMLQKRVTPSLVRIQEPFKGVIAKCLKQNAGERPTAEWVCRELG